MRHTPRSVTPMSSVPTGVSGTTSKATSSRLAAAAADDDPACDREHPGTEVLTVLEPRIRPQGTEKRLLKRVLGPVAAEPAVEEAKDLVPVGCVEGLERRDHYSMKRTRARRCE